jgi:maltooligosyltrehalose synthase
LFSEGEYVPLAVTGSAARHVCAFAWQLREAGQAMKQVVVIIPRLLAQLATAGEPPGPRPLWQADTWGDTQVEFAIQSGQVLRNLFSGSTLSARASIPVSSLFAEFPIAVLTSG